MVYAEEGGAVSPREWAALLAAGMAALANHSAEPNLQKVMDAESVFLELLRDVEAGEELCFTYSDYARTRYGLA